MLILYLLRFVLAQKKGFDFFIYTTEQQDEDLGIGKTSEGDLVVSRKPTMFKLSLEKEGFFIKTSDSKNDYLDLVSNGLQRERGSPKPWEIYLNQTLSESTKKNHYQLKKNEKCLSKTKNGGLKAEDCKITNENQLFFFKAPMNGESKELKEILDKAISVRLVEPTGDVPTDLMKSNEETKDALHIIINQKTAKPMIKTILVQPIPNKSEMEKEINNKEIKPIIDRPANWENKPHRPTKHRRSRHRTPSRHEVPKKQHVDDYSTDISGYDIQISPSDDQDPTSEESSLILGDRTPQRPPRDYKPSGKENVRPQNRPVERPQTDTPDYSEEEYEKRLKRRRRESDKYYSEEDDYDRQKPENYRGNENILPSEFIKGSIREAKESKLFRDLYDNNDEGHSGLADIKEKAVPFGNQPQRLPRDEDRRRRDEKGYNDFPNQDRKHVEERVIVEASVKGVPRDTVNRMSLPLGKSTPKYSTTTVYNTVNANNGPSSYNPPMPGNRPYVPPMNQQFNRPPPYAPMNQQPLY